MANMDRDRCMEINYHGTRNIVEAIKSSGRSIPLVVTSSVSVMGPTQHNNRLVRPEDPLIASDYYSESKIEMEKYLSKQHQNYLVFRIAGVLPTLNHAPPNLIGAMFDLHPDARMEMIIDRDVAMGLLHGIHCLAENKDMLQGRAFILGGGKKNGCQIIVKDLLEKLFGSMGLPVPDRKYFAQDLNDQYIDWYDTTEAEQLFDFQHHHLHFYFDYVNKAYGKFKPLIRLFRKPILRKLVSYSPVGKT
jgi:nucleoside-diphosphate-sugar epimerase